MPLFVSPTIFSMPFSHTHTHTHLFFSFCFHYYFSCHILFHLLHIPSELVIIICLLFVFLPFLHGYMLFSPSCSAHITLHDTMPILVSYYLLPYFPHAFPWLLEVTCHTLHCFHYISAHMSYMSLFTRGGGEGMRWQECLFCLPSMEGACFLKSSVLFILPQVVGGSRVAAEWTSTVTPENGVSTGLSPPSFQVRDKAKSVPCLQAHCLCPWEEKPKSTHAAQCSSQVVWDRSCLSRSAMPGVKHLLLLSPSLFFWAHAMPCHAMFLHAKLFFFLPRRSSFLFLCMCSLWGEEKIQRQSPP